MRLKTQHYYFNKMGGVIALDVPVEEEDELFRGLEHHLRDCKVSYVQFQGDVHSLMNEDFA